MAQSYDSMMGSPIDPSTAGNYNLPEGTPAMQQPTSDGQSMQGGSAMQDALMQALQSAKKKKRK